MKTERFRVTYEWDGGVWLATVPAVGGCYTQGATVEQARERIREALAAVLDNDEAAAAALFDEEIGQLPYT